jgi:hypothetical protein
MVKKKEYLTKIAALLPEGLDESVLEKIAELLANKIQEEVKTQMSDINLKVVSFIKGQIEKLKEHAVKELELENETFRNARLFETVRSMFALENTHEDDVNGASILASIGENQEQKIQTLVTELDRVLKENSQHKRTNKLLATQNESLKESVTKLTENVKVITEKGTQKKLSDKAVVVSEQNFKIGEAKKIENKQKEANGNEWLNESTLDANRKLKQIKG